ncbi:hypothetical protein T492DRAFT_1124340 [Pavlovales sp. CCMP2436]|nr:hypothetical protein T492DRAFT_1124340 [Pavlovales sp. CCMP2436]
MLPPKLLALFSSTLWLFCLDSFAAQASLPVAVFGGARGQAIYLASHFATLFAFSFGVVPLMGTTSIALAVRLQRTRVTDGGELGVYESSAAFPAADWVQTEMHMWPGCCCCQRFKFNAKKRAKEGFHG